MLLGAGAAVAALVVVGGIVLAISGPKPSPSPGPDATLTAGGSDGPTTPATIGPPPSIDGPTASPEPTASPTAPPPPTPSPTPTGPPAPVDNAGPTGGAISLTGNISKALTTTRDITVSITAVPVDGSKVCARLASNASTRPASNASGWVSYGGKKITFDHRLADDTYGKHTVYVWFRDCSSARNVSAKAAIATVKFDHAPKVVADGDCNVHQYVPLSGFHPKYWVGYETRCFTDADGAAPKLQFGGTTYGTWQQMTSAELTANCPQGNACLWYVPNQPWGGGAYDDSFKVWAVDTDGVSSAKIDVTLCVNQTSC